jgi:hypothetical protein
MIVTSIYKFKIQQDETQIKNTSKQMKQNLEKTEIIGKWNNFNWILYKICACSKLDNDGILTQQGCIEQIFHTTYNDVKRITFWIIKCGIN